MTGCFAWLLLIGGGIFVIMTLIRWFEHTTDAVERRAWDKVMLLLAMPFAAWMYPSRVVAGRPVPAPLHQPVRGRGGMKTPAGAESTQTAPEQATMPASAMSPAPPAGADDGPPPGTPKEFLGMPKVPPPAKKGAGAHDPEKLAKLRQKMREQGMLPDDGKEAGGN